MARLPGGRGTALLAAFAKAADMGARAQNDSFAFELDDLGQSQTCLSGEEEQHVIAPADPCAPVRRRQDRVDLLAGQEMHLTLVPELASYCEQALDLPPWAGS